MTNIQIIQTYSFKYENEIIFIYKPEESAIFTTTISSSSDSLSLIEVSAEQLEYTWKKIEV